MEHKLTTWKYIDVAFHGPYKILNSQTRDSDDTNNVGNYIIVTIFDTFSKWMSATPIELNSPKEGGEQEADAILPDPNAEGAATAAIPPAVNAGEGAPTAASPPEPKRPPSCSPQPTIPYQSQELAGDATLTKRPAAAPHG